MFHSMASKLLCKNPSCKHQTLREAFSQLSGLIDADHVADCGFNYGGDEQTRRIFKSVSNGQTTI